MNDKVILFYISYYIDDPKTWLNFMLTCKNAKIVCDYRKEQKQYQFEKVIISGNDDSEVLLIRRPYTEWTINNNVGFQSCNFSMTRLELLRILGESKI